MVIDYFWLRLGLLWLRDGKGLGLGYSYAYHRYGAEFRETDVLTSHLCVNCVFRLLAVQIPAGSLQPDYSLEDRK